MFNKLVPVLFLVGIMIPSACVTVNVDDENNTSANNTSTSTGASGVPTTKKANDFTPTEKQDFCDWLTGLVADREGEVISCGADLEVTIEPYPKSECEAQLANNPGCPVSELEGCFEILLGDPCLLFAETAPAACAALDQCAQDVNSNNVTINSNNVTTMDSFCYEHDCNGDATGEQCFSTQDAYCDSLCLETNCISTVACENECF